MLASPSRAHLLLLVVTAAVLIPAAARTSHSGAFVVSSPVASKKTLRRTVTLAERAEAAPALLLPQAPSPSPPPVHGEALSRYSMAAEPSVLPPAVTQTPIKKRHLGPTTEDILSIRRTEREERLKEMAQRARAEAQAEEEPDTPLPSVDMRGSDGGAKGGRHLGPTLNEIQAMRSEEARERLENMAAQGGPRGGSDRAAPPSPKAPSAAADASDAPTGEQLRALEEYGVPRGECPRTKGAAATRLREIREAYLGRKMGCDIDVGAMTSGEAQSAGAEDARDEARRVIGEYTATPQAGAQHWQYAVRGISTIKRRGEISQQDQ